MDILVVAFLTSARAALSGCLLSTGAGAAGVAGVAGAASVFAGSGTAAGAGSAGFVSVGFAVEAGASVVAEGVGWSLVFFLRLKMPLMAPLTLSNASGALNGDMTLAVSGGCSDLERGSYCVVRAGGCGGADGGSVVLRNGRVRRPAGGLYRRKKAW